MRQSTLTDPHTTIVLAYAPAGLGHLRVTRALYEGLPPDLDPILLPDPTMSVRNLHRFTSNNLTGRNLMEWMQYGSQETFFTRIYRALLQRDAHLMEETLIKVLKQRIYLPETLIVVASHFGIAHQIAAIKHELIKKAHVRVVLIVQVTDDSPQKMWYVPHADCIFVPSEETRKSLLRYARFDHLAASPITVIPYPVSPQLTRPLLPEEFANRQHQSAPHFSVPVHIAVPISGAAVGLSFLRNLIDSLVERLPRTHVHIIGKRVLFTEQMLHEYERKPYATVYESHSDRQIVELYEQAYSETVMLLEITKPSEQAFKALMTPRKRGGSILLFAKPVGRQEYDNLSFLRRHKLIPSPDEELYLWALYQGKLKEYESLMLAEAIHWRGLILPEDSVAAATFIIWCHQHGFFTNMLRANPESRGDESVKAEVAENGVAQFWEHVEKIVNR